MTTKNLTSDQKLDLILEKVITLEKNQSTLEKNQSTLEKNQSTLEKNQNDLVKTVGEIAILAGKTADKLEDLSHDVSDIKDEQERQGKKLDQISGSKSFNPFKGGAFVA